MDEAVKQAGQGCVLGWDPAHCPLDVDCRFWSRVEDRCRYAERRDLEMPAARGGWRPATAPGN